MMAKVDGEMIGIYQKVLEKFKELLAARTPLRSVILFGSWARGDADLYSDVDVLVILDNTANEQDREIVSECAWEAGFDAGIIVAPVVFTRDEWEKGPERASLLAQAVKAEGVRL
jgi:predicted nucleotidyltransferase